MLGPNQQEIIEDGPAFDSLKELFTQYEFPVPDQISSFFERLSSSSPNVKEIQQKINTYPNSLVYEDFIGNYTHLNGLEIFQEMRSGMG